MDNLGGRKNLCYHAIGGDKGTGGKTIDVLLRVEETIYTRLRWSRPGLATNCRVLIDNKVTVAPSLFKKKLFL